MRKINIDTTLPALTLLKNACKSLFWAEVTFAMPFQRELQRSLSIFADGTSPQKKTKKKKPCVHHRSLPILPQGHCLYQCGKIHLSFVAEFQAVEV